MVDNILDHYAAHELKYQMRKQVSQEIRNHCSDSDPMVTGITVMLGTVLAMAVFCAMLGTGSRGRGR
jgi:hypothetical protein